MYTVKQASAAVGISVSTVRQWGKEYADFMSPLANPEKGKPRRYTDDDIAVLHTVNVLRAEFTPHEDIEHRLETGDRLEPLATVKPPPETPPAPPETPPESHSQPGKGLITKELAEYFLNALERANTNLLEAEKRAAIAETRAEMLQQQIEELKQRPEPADETPEVKPVSEDAPPPVTHHGKKLPPRQGIANRLTRAMLELFGKPDEDQA